MDLPLRFWVEKTVPGVKTNWLSGKEKISGSAVSKVETSMKGPITIDFLEKRSNRKQHFLLPTSLAKFNLFIEWTSYLW